MVIITADILFFLVCSLLLSHELDAVHKREWRLLYLLRKMPEKKARSIFILLHIPLITLLLWLGTNTNETTRFWTIIGIDIFCRHSCHTALAATKPSIESL